MNCNHCNANLVKSDAELFEIKSFLLPQPAKRMKAKNLSLWVCDKCGLIETHHTKQGFLGYYNATLDRFWNRLFSTGKVSSLQDAEDLFREGGYRQCLTHASFMKEFEIFYPRWLEKGSTKKYEIIPEQNTLLDRDLETADLASAE